MNEKKFFFKYLRNIVFLGASPLFENLFKINKIFKIRSEIISCKDQVKEFKLKKNIKIFNKLNSNFKNYLRKKYNFEETLFISMGARWIFGTDIINNFFTNNLINFHHTRLPFEAGGAGDTWKVMRNDRIDTQIAHMVEAGIDSGPILMDKSFLIPSKLILPSEIVEFRSKNFLKFYDEFIKKIKNKQKFNLKFQPDYIGRYNPRLNTKLNGWIDWSIEPLQLLNFINAFGNPYAGASTLINKRRVYIKDVQLHGGEMINHPFSTGLITRHDKKWLVVATAGTFSLIIEKVFDKNNKNIINQLKVGDRFFTPYKFLDNSKEKRIIYNTKGLKN
jgi:methionyl-tRNA formyltransferase